MIVLPPLASPVDQLWHVLLDLSGSLPVPWTLAGGQMVLLTAKDRQRLRRVRALADDNHIAWSLVPAEIRSQGQITFGVLTAD